jgi:DNA-binding SARP family transcriptional activator
MGERMNSVTTLRRPAELRISLIGRLRAHRGPNEVALGSTQQRAVLAWLALSADHVVARAELVDLLWGDRPPPTATNIVQTYVKRLRQALEPDRPSRTASRWLPRIDDGYCLCIEPDAVDVLSARRRVAEARASRRGSDPARIRILLADVLAGWTEPVLADLPQVADRPEVAALDGVRREAVELDSEAAMELGLPADVVGRLAEAALVEPFNELVHARLMEVYRLTGRRADAMCVYEDIVGRLADELGVGPGPELVGAHRSLLGGAWSVA